MGFQGGSPGSSFGDTHFPMPLCTEPEGQAQPSLVQTRSPLQQVPLQGSLPSSHFFTQAFRLPKKLLSQTSPLAQQRVSPHCTPGQVQSPSSEPQISPTRQHHPSLIAWGSYDVQKLEAVALMLQYLVMYGFGWGPPG
jgi:hypothetical protein